jgi:hypothetical protein
VLRRARGHKAELSLCLCVVRLGLENGKWKVEINGLGRFAVWGGILKK